MIHLIRAITEIPTAYAPRREFGFSKREMKNDIYK